MGFFTLLRQEPRILSFGLVHTATSSVGQTFLIALFLPGIKASFELNDAEVASVYAFATLASAAVLWWCGRWVDKIDVLHYSLASGLFLLLACVLTAASSTLAVLALGLFCLRLGGQGLLTHIAVTSISRYFTKSRGTALSLTSIGYSLGEAILPAVVVLLIGILGWRVTYAIAGVFALLAIIGAAWLVRHESRFRTPHADRRANSIEVKELASTETRPGHFTSRYWVVNGPLFVATPLVMTALVFHQAVIAESKGIPLQVFAVSLAAFAFARLGGSLATGPAIDRYGSGALFALHLVPMCVALVFLVAGTSTWVVPVYWVLAGLSSGASGTLQAAIIAEHVPPHRLGAVRARVASVAILATAGGPAAYGWLLSSGFSMSAILWGTVVTLLFATILGIADHLRPHGRSLNVLTIPK